MSNLNKFEFHTITIRFPRLSLFLAGVSVITALYLAVGGVSTHASSSPKMPFESVAANTLNPVLLTLSNSNRAMAVESTTWQTEPFSPSSSIPFGADNRTRIGLFALYFDLLPGEDLSSIAASAQDSTLQTFPLTVEYVTKLPDCPDVSYVVVRLADQLGDVGDVLVSLNLHGLLSNRARVGIGHIGGGPPNDPTPTPTPGTTHFISGEVMDSAGIGLPNTTVTLSNAGGALIQTAMTINDGSFSFTGLTAGTNVTVAAVPTTLFTFDPVAFTNLSSDGTAMLLGRLRSYNVSGRVTKNGSTGLSSALMTCSDGFISRTTLSDSNGNYAFSQLTAGRNITVSAIKVGYVFATGSVLISNLTANKTGVNFSATAAPTPTPTPTPTPAPTATPTPTPTPTPNPSTLFSDPAGSGTLCTIASPCTLETAQSKLPASGGWALCLTHGVNKTYKGKYAFTKSAQFANSPNVIRSCDATGSPAIIGPWNAGWAKIDGGVTSTLAVALTAGAPFTDCTIVTAPGANFSEGASVEIDPSNPNLRESVQMWGKQADGVTWNNCQCGRGGTARQAHSIGAPMYSADNTLTLSASNTILRDFEILDSHPTRKYDFNFNNTTIAIRGSGLTVQNNSGAKVINLVIHDTSVGIYANESAIGLEIYGVIVFNNGFVDWSRGHGPGFYLANDPAVQKKVRNVIAFNGFVDCMKSYTSSGHAQNFLYENVMAFNCGVSSTFPGNHGVNGSDIPPEHRDSAIFVGANGASKNTDNVKIHNVYLYQPLNSAGALLWTGYFPDVGSVGLEVTNSRIMGGTKPFTVAYKTLTVTGNRFYAQGPSPASNGNALVDLKLDAGYSGNWNNNTYYDQTPNYAFPVVPFPFLVTIGGTLKQACSGGGVLRYSDICATPGGGFIQHTGFDASSTYTRAAPTGTEVFVIPNEYEIGRAHIAIYNWALNPSVNVDLSNVLAVGDTYAIYAVEDYLGAPVKTGTYNGTPVAIPMTGTTVASPIGLGWTPPTVRPQFGVFVVRKQ